MVLKASLISWARYQFLQSGPKLTYCSESMPYTSLLYDALRYNDYLLHIRARIITRSSGFTYLAFVYIFTCPVIVYLLNQVII